MYYQNGQNTHKKWLFPKSQSLRVLFKTTKRQVKTRNLLENDIELRYIQYIKTEIYTHITQTGIENIKKLLDDFDFEQE